MLGPLLLAFPVAQEQWCSHLLQGLLTVFLADPIPVLFTHQLVSGSKFVNFFIGTQMGKNSESYLY